MHWTPSAEFLLYLEKIGTSALFIPSIVLIAVSLFLSWKTRFVQFRAIPDMLSLFWGNISRKGASSKSTVSANKALFTAMSTSLGLTSMVSPMIAIRMGGPGAVLGYLLATFLGAALSFVEVKVALHSRTILPDGTLMGGPMQYIKKYLHPSLAKIYAIFTLLMLLFWTSTQANTIADLMNDYAVPDSITGIFLALLVLMALLGGIKRIANISAKLVPVMIVIYFSACLWVLFTNLGSVPAVCGLICETAFDPHTLSAGVVTGGIVQSLRWGLLKGIHSNEAGVGTATIPHSMSNTENADEQGILSMFSVYSQGLLSIVSAFVTIVSGVWDDPNIPLGIHITLASFQTFFSSGATVIITLCALLFGYGTILGNNFNGSQCFSFLSHNRGIRRYHVFTCLIAFLGAIASVELIWAIVDFFIVPVILINVLCLAWIAIKQPKLVLYKKIT